MKLSHPLILITVLAVLGSSVTAVAFRTQPTGQPIGRDKPPAPKPLAWAGGCDELADQSASHRDSRELRPIRPVYSDNRCVNCHRDPQDEQHVLDKQEDRDTENRPGVLVTVLNMDY